MRKHSKNKTNKPKNADRKVAERIVYKRNGIGSKSETLWYQQLKTLFRKY